MFYYRVIIILLTLGVMISGFLRIKVASKNDLARENKVAGVKNVSLNQENFKVDRFALPPSRKNDSYPNVSAAAVYLYDVESAYPLYSLNSDQKLPIASLTKLMTAMIVMDNYQLDEKVEVTKEAISVIGSKIDLRQGEVLTVESLLKGMLVQSGNDAAYALANKMGFDEFINKMNRRAVNLGMHQTLFKDPAGLDDQAYSSARDVAIMAALALRNQTIGKIVKIDQTIITSVDGKLSHQIETSNRLIKPDHPLFLSSVTGLKTGFTPEAGHCLVASSNYRGHQLISVILNTADQSVEASAQETYRLLTWAYENFEFN